jgi:hypothetical protein
MNEINKLEIDYEKGILKINGEEIKEAIVVSLPVQNSWNKSKIFNLEKFHDKCRRLTVEIKEKGEIK